MYFGTILLCLEAQIRKVPYPIGEGPPFFLIAYGYDIDPEISMPFYSYRYRDLNRRIRSTPGVIPVSRNNAQEDRTDTPVETSGRVAWAMRPIIVRGNIQFFVYGLYLRPEDPTIYRFPGNT